MRMAFRGGPRAWLLGVMCLAGLGVAELGGPALGADAAPGAKAMAPPTADSVNWDQAKGWGQLNGALIPATYRGEMVASEMAILLPEDPSLLKGLTWMHGPLWYSVTLVGRGLNLTIHGSRASIKMPELKMDPSIGGSMESPILSLESGMGTATFSAFGMAYTLDVECGPPEVASPCDSKDALRAFVSTLRVLEHGE